MKIAPLLAKFLYIHKRMDLPGLGTFLLDPSVTIEPESSKHAKPVNLEGVSFESKPSLKESPELIQFISSQTGKIKALAAADLDSHLGLAQQFLNIGKPFLFEGIGSMVKIQSGEFAFTSGLVMPALMKDYSVKEISSTSHIEESSAEYNSIFARKTKTKWKKPVAVILFLAGLALAIWGGYTVYKKTTAKKDNTPAVEDKKEETVLVKDTARYQEDSVIAPVTMTIVPAGNYKFVLETSNAQRAFSRYSKLKTFQWNVQMETKDSLSYKIFMVLPVIPSDTTRILDSLSSLTGKRVYIER
ncbi:MAG: hypothetical protein H7Y01_13535 [Ferruginibacter sp.]|nr:hypothetical protein [Chitinophagaceae bacterium]